MIGEQFLEFLAMAILHRGNSERAHRFAVRLWDVNPSQGLRLITPTLECMYCLCFLLWCAPNFLVHTGGFSCYCFPSLVERRELCRYTSGSAGVAELAPCPICLPSLPARYALGVGERCG